MKKYVTKVFCILVIVLFIGASLPAKPIDKPLGIIQLDDELIAHWDFNSASGTIVTDSSGNGHNGVIYGGATFSEDNPWIGTSCDENEYSLEFDGIDDYVDFGNAEDLDIGTNDYSINAWIKFKNNPNGFCGIITKGALNPTDEGFALQYFHGETNQLNFWISDGTNRIHPKIDNVGQQFEDNEWHCLSITIDRSEGLVTFYIDAIIHTICAYDTLEFTESEDISNLDNNLLIGVWDIFESTQYFNGFIDDVRLFSKELTIEEIEQLCSCDDEDCYPPPIIYITKPLDGGFFYLNGDEEVRLRLFDIKPGKNVTVIIGPQNGITLQASAEDENGIDTVKFLIDGEEKVAELTDQGYYEYHWIETKIGTSSIQAVAYDTGGCYTYTEEYDVFYVNVENIGGIAETIINFILSLVDTIPAIAIVLIIIVLFFT